MDKTKKPDPEVIGVSEPKAGSRQAASQPHMESHIPPPAFIADSLREVKKKPAPKPEDDEILAEGAKSDFWKILKRWIEWQQKKIKENTGQQISSGSLTLEQIGLKSLWRDLVIDSFQDLVDFVEKRADLIEAIKIEKQSAEAERAKEENDQQSE